MKLRATLTAKKRLTELGWKVCLNHQEGCAENTHYWLSTNIPYRGYSWVRPDGTRTGGNEYKEWKESFYKRERFVRFLKRYYPHHINFWDWDALEEAIKYEEIHIYKTNYKYRPFPYPELLFRR